jgi:hypothetical protein
VNAAPQWFTGGVISRLLAAYPSWPCSAGTVQVFWDTLCDLPREAVEHAAAEHVALEPAWPLAANLRRLAKATDEEVSLTASEAWEEMYRHRHAHSRNPQWSSPAVERAASAVNWDSPDWLREQLPTIRAQFERYYTAIEKREGRTRARVEVSTLLRLASGGQQPHGPRGLFARGEA